MCKNVSHQCETGKVSQLVLFFYFFYKVLTLAMLQYTMSQKIFKRNYEQVSTALQKNHRSIFVEYFVSSELTSLTPELQLNKYDFL